MSKVVLSLPDRMIKNSVVGVGVSLSCYILLQFVSAFLVCNEFVGEEMIYPMVCVSAAVSSFAGCFAAALRIGKGVALSAMSVVAIFLTLTVAIGLCVNENGATGGEFLGVGVAMVVGGIAASVLGAVTGKRVGDRRERNRNMRRRM